MKERERGKGSGRGEQGRELKRIKTEQRVQMSDHRRRYVLAVKGSELVRLGGAKVGRALTKVRAKRLI